MNQRDLTYGLIADSLEDVRDQLIDLFKCDFELRYSDYLGGYYFFSQHGEEEIRIQLNRDGDSVAEEEFAEMTVLVLVDGCTVTQRWTQWAENATATLIRENVY